MERTISNERVKNAERTKIQERARHYCVIYIVTDAIHGSGTSQFYRENHVKEASQNKRENQPNPNELRFVREP